MSIFSKNKDTEWPLDKVTTTSKVTDDECLGTIYGKTEDGKVVSRRMNGVNHTNGNVAVIGPSGTGKNNSVVNPFFLQCVRRGESVIVTDPFGDMKREFGELCEEQGYKVRCLDFLDPQNSDGWNCMYSKGNSDAEEAAAMFAEAVVKCAGFPETAEGSIYAEGAALLIRAIYLRMQMPDFHDKNRFRDFLRIFSKENTYEVLDRMFSFIPTEGMRVDGSGASTWKDEQLSNACLNAWQAFTYRSQNMKENIIANTAVTIANLDSKANQPLVAALTENDIGPFLPGKEKCAYFVKFPDNNTTFQPFVRMFIMRVYRAVCLLADSMSDGKLPVKVNFILDEFPNLGTIQCFERSIAVMRPRGIQALISMNDITQLKHLYGDMWLTILGNCATWAVTGVADMETAQVFAERYEDSPLYKTAEARNLCLMDPDKLVICAQCCEPVELWKFDYREHPLIKKRNKK